MTNRRNFIRSLGAGVTGIILAGKNGFAKNQSSTDLVNSPKIKSYRPLGHTGLKISEIGAGTINFYNTNVLRYAYDCGVNHFDTAEAYGSSESYLPRALKEIRKNVIITSKYQMRNAADYNRASLISRVEGSLKRLQTDYLDVGMVHAVDDVESLAHEEVIAAFTQLKKDGKIRFTGFSTHKPDVLLPHAIASGLWEVVLLVYNHMEGFKIEPVIARARKKGIGIIAMKVFAGGMQGDVKNLEDDKSKYSQTAIRWVLSNPMVDACIVTMSTFAHVDEYVSASGVSFKRKDKKILSQYQSRVNEHYCRVSCSECLSSCPHGVAVNDVLRFAMYYRHYGMEKKAIQFYNDLKPLKKPLACFECNAPCMGSCPNGLAVKDKLLEAVEFLTIS